MDRKKAGLAVLGVLFLGLSLFLIERGMRSVDSQSVPKVSSSELRSVPDPALSDTVEEENTSREEREIEVDRDSSGSAPDSDDSSDRSAVGILPDASEGASRGEKEQEPELEDGADALPAFQALFSSFKVYEPAESFPPDLEISSTEGRVFRFGDFRGGWLVVNFWASWCPPCIKELPAINALYQRFRSSPLQIVAVSLDQALDSKGVADLIKTKKLGDVALYYDPKNAIQKALSLESLPVTFIVNPNGQVVYRIDGEGAWDRPAAERFLSSLLKK